MVSREGLTRAISRCYRLLRRANRKNPPLFSSFHVTAATERRLLF